MSLLEDPKKISVSQEIEITFIENAIPAGFPSPAQDYMNDGIDLNKELIKHPSSTFCARVSGNSMIDSGIENGDLLIIDKSIEAQNGSIAVCYVDGEFTLKRIRIDKGELYLVPANPDYPPIHVAKESNFQVWGIVVYVIKNMLR